jgi:predicted secreted hydrolase
MSRWIFLISIAVTLSGCCGLGTSCGVTPRVHLLAWDGLNPDNSNRPPERPTRIFHSRPTGRSVAAADHSSNKEAELAALPKYSQEWWSVHDQIEVEADAKLARALVICRGCLPSNADDRTASVK